jgi:hypothetical protein
MDAPNFRKNEGFNTCGFHKPPLQVYGSATSLVSIAMLLWEIR